MTYNAKILLIEDEELSQITTRKLLESFGCNVDVGTTGAAGVRLFEQNVYDLVFVDLKIFDMDGFKVARKIKELQKNSKNKTPMVVLSSHDEDGVKKIAKKLGFKDYITKPLNEDQCRVILRDFASKELKESGSGSVSLVDDSHTSD